MARPREELAIDRPADRPNDATRSSNGGRTPGKYAEGRATDDDRTGAETDQTLSDGDQTLSDGDQTASESDQAQADSDQRSSDRDQLAAERDKAARTLSRESQLEAFETSQADRATSAAARFASTEARGLTTLQRFETASRRDEQAGTRDLVALARDRTADIRDRVAEEYEQGTGRRSSEISRIRVDAAADRARAAADRAHAADDRKRAAADREHAWDELQKAQLDELTGFYRIGLGRAMLQREIDRSRRSDGRMVLGYCDLDGLKQRNDEEGHPAGDALLVAAAAAIRSRVRSYDHVVRVGGDEFICAIVEADLEQAGRIFAEIQAHLEGADGGGSMSFGLASLREDDTLDTLIERSDGELRKAKRARR
jgi:diguanylate cyclase (GGDEF)-like protein